MSSARQRDSYQGGGGGGHAQADLLSKVDHMLERLSTQRERKKRWAETAAAQGLKAEPPRVSHFFSSFSRDERDPSASLGGPLNAQFGTLQHHHSRVGEDSSDRLSALPLSRPSLSMLTQGSAPSPVNAQQHDRERSLLSSSPGTQIPQRVKFSDDWLRFALVAMSKELGNLKVQQGETAKRLGGIRSPLHRDRRGQHAYRGSEENETEDTEEGSFEPQAPNALGPSRRQRERERESGGERGGKHRDVTEEEVLWMRRQLERLTRRNSKLLALLEEQKKSRRERDRDKGRDRERRERRWGEEREAETGAEDEEEGSPGGRPATSNVQSGDEWNQRGRVRGVQEDRSTSRIQGQSLTYTRQTSIPSSTGPPPPAKAVRKGGPPPPKNKPSPPESSRPQDPPPWSYAPAPRSGVSRQREPVQESPTGAARGDEDRRAHVAQLIAAQKDLQQLQDRLDAEEEAAKRRRASWREMGEGEQWGYLRQASAGSVSAPLPGDASVVSLTGDEGERSETASAGLNEQVKLLVSDTVRIVSEDTGGGSAPPSRSSSVIRGGKRASVSKKKASSSPVKKKKSVSAASGQKTKTKTSSSARERSSSMSPGSARAPRKSLQIPRAPSASLGSLYGGSKRSTPDFGPSSGSPRKAQPKTTKKLQRSASMASHTSRTSVSSGSPVRSSPKRRSTSAVKSSTLLKPTKAQIEREAANAELIRSLRSFESTKSITDTKSKRDSSPSKAKSPKAKGATQPLRTRSLSRRSLASSAALSSAYSSGGSQFFTDQGSMSRSMSAISLSSASPSRSRSSSPKRASPKRRQSTGTATAAKGSAKSRPALSGSTFARRSDAGSSAAGERSSTPSQTKRRSSVKSPPARPSSKATGSPGRKASSSQLLRSGRGVLKGGALSKAPRREGSSASVRWA
uniref:Uncharacterized protein n=1 Tax=Chromera velia CCMP2878 TaxID=1169474 RepID=A0A0G4FAJ4_9ALVE|eukprot:Cvel_15915.t1-p1 / transcript=Cvel_15915.t1 / gene=Cvel_15915 / organism=Chromera_velia_CCMP2878 / gene_product=hypothetical protein / transcript_product=hypothetical protein / location=Cvel_scaffold1203:21891-28215(+) / protein_length=911 / sequence_SO=supercontig / SO=protein_coding / is_pseudo=false